MCFMHIHSMRLRYLWMDVKRCGVKHYSNTCITHENEIKWDGIFNTQWSKEHQIQRRTWPWYHRSRQVTWQNQNRSCVNSSAEDTTSTGTNGIGLLSHACVNLAQHPSTWGRMPTPLGARRSLSRAWHSGVRQLSRARGIPGSDSYPERVTSRSPTALQSARHSGV